MTDKLYTGQQQETEIGLDYYVSRYYDPEIANFIQPDSIITYPENALSYDRYTYANNNPIKYNDPSGHWVETALDIAFIIYDIYDIKVNGLTWVSGLSLAADVAGALLPVVTGAGLGVRAIAHADDVVDAAKAADTIIDVVETTNKADDVVDAVTHGDEVVDTLTHADDATGLRQPDLPDWPSRPEEMDEILGISGEKIPDLPKTPGRDKVVWNPSDKIIITFERHPYDIGAPDFHTGNHWHIEWPGLSKHKTYLPGELMPY